MIIDFSEFLNILLHISLIVLVVVFILVGIKLIKTLDKVDVIIDDVNNKMNKVNGVFDIVDKATDYASGISDKILNVVSKLFTIFTKRKKGNDEDE